MAITHGPRLGLTRWSDDDDEVTREQLDADHALLEELALIYRQGLEADLPDAVDTEAGTLYYATDTKRLRLAYGGWWQEVAGGTILGGDPTGPASIHIGAQARSDVGALVAWRGSLNVSAEAGTAIYARGPATATDAAVVVARDNPGIGLEQRTRIDADGAVRIGRAGSTVDPEVPRSAFLTVRPHSAAERGIVVDGAGTTTADLIRASTNGTRRFTVDAKGRVYLSSLSDNDTPATPGGAGVLFCDDAGRLKYRGTGGTVTTLAPA